MKSRETNEQVLKAISIGLAAFIAGTAAPMTVMAETNDSYEHETQSSYYDLIDSDVASIVVQFEDTDENIVEAAQAKAEDITDTQKVYGTVMDSAKYTYDFAESVVGEKKWDYERALYAYNKAQNKYKEYQKNNLKFWKWNKSKEYEEYIAAKEAYCNADKSLKQAQKAMDEAECAYNSINMMKKAW